MIVALFVISAPACGSALPCSASPGSAWSFFTTRPGGDALALTVWGSLSSWTLTRCRCSSGWARSCSRAGCRKECSRPGAMAAMAAGPAAAHEHHRLHDLRGRVRVVRRPPARRSEITLRNFPKRGYPDRIAIRFARRRRHPRAADPPSIIMIVYGVARRFDRKALHRRMSFRLMLAGLVMGYTMFWALRNASQVRRPDILPDLLGEVVDRATCCRWSPDRRRARLDLRRDCDGDRSRRARRLGALILSAAQRIADVDASGMR